MSSVKRPNFLLIIADDLGYSDLGCYGGEIKTPSIDKLANDGIRFSDYRSDVLGRTGMVMSGTDSHVAMQHVMVNVKNQDTSNYNTAGNEGYLTRNIAAMPELLADAGYTTLMSGTWHLGFRPGYIPSDRGFQRVFSCLPASSNHFGYDPPWEGGEAQRPGVHGHQPPIYVKQDKRFVVEPNMSSSSEGYYSSHAFADEMLRYLRERKATSNGPEGQPFFAYLPFTAPHYPLQCLPADREKYRGIYDRGPGHLRSARLRKLVQLGIINPDTVPHEVHSPENSPWDDLSPKEQRFSLRAMECYAGMVHAMDREIGRVVDYLSETGELDNTVVMFFSDNGAEGTALEAEEVVGPQLIEVINAQASTAPNRLYKHYTTEGGIRVPLVVRYPGFTSPSSSLCHAFTTAMDILPTFLDLAGIQNPNATPSDPRSTAEYQDRQVYPMRGKSWVPLLSHQITALPGDERAAVYGDDRPLIAWEHYGKAAVRSGRWRIVNMPVEHPTGTGRWQLYDMYTDQGETLDLAEQLPDKVTELVKEWEQWLAETGTHYTTPVESSEGFLERDIIGDQRAWMRMGNGEPFDLTG